SPLAQPFVRGMLGHRDETREYNRETMTLGKRSRASPTECLLPHRRRMVKSSRLSTVREMHWRHAASALPELARDPIGAGFRFTQPTLAAMPATTRNRTTNRVYAFQGP